MDHQTHSPVIDHGSRLSVLSALSGPSDIRPTLEASGEVCGQVEEEGVGFDLGITELNCNLEKCRISCSALLISETHMENHGIHMENQGFQLASFVSTHDDVELNHYTIL